MRKLGSGWVCDDCHSFGKEGEVTPHSPQCPRREVPFGPGEADVEARPGLGMTPLVELVEGAQGLYRAAPLEATGHDTVVNEAELSPDELRELGALADSPPRVEPQPPGDLELDKPPATVAELRALAGLPSTDEALCGAPGPDGRTCRLKPGHEGGLHAAKGFVWVDDVAGQQLDPHQAAAEQLWGKADREPPADAPALVRIAVALEGLQDIIKHYVEEMLHRQRL
jgi:hypothetical protein